MIDPHCEQCHGHGLVWLNDQHARCPRCRLARQKAQRVFVASVEDLKDALIWTLRAVTWEMAHCYVYEWGGVFVIEYGFGLESPTLNSNQLFELSELLGTDNINTEQYEHEGCETCDYGAYGSLTLIIRNPTRNVEQLKHLVGQDIVRNMDTYVPPNLEGEDNEIDSECG